MNYVSCALLNSLISSSNSLIVSLGFSMYRNWSSANNENFSSCFIIWIDFISFSCLIVLVMTYKTVLYNNRESRHPGCS